MSKSAGSALDRIIRSRSSVVSLFNFALLFRVLAVLNCRVISTIVPVLEPHLNLTRTQARDFTRQTLTMCSIRMRLSRELAHQEPSLIVRQSDSR